MKKIVAIMISAILMVSILIIPASAFGGYAHWEIANRTVAQNNIPTNNNYALAYKTGTLLADIGNPSWDNKYTVSDSSKFAKEMMSINSPNEQGKYFARGWQSHVYQDTTRKITDIISDGDKYYENYGQLDEYLRDKLKISCPINGTSNMYIVYEMIRNTYKTINVFAPTNQQIDSEIKSLFNRYHVLIALNFSGMSNTQITNMNNVFNYLAKNGYKTNSIYSNSASSKQTHLNKDPMEFILKERENPIKHAMVLSLETQIDSCTHIEAISTDEFGGVEARFVIDDEIKYNSLIDKYASVLCENPLYTFS